MISDADTGLVLMDGCLLGDLGHPTALMDKVRPTENPVRKRCNSGKRACSVVIDIAMVLGVALVILGPPALFFDVTY